MTAARIREAAKVLRDAAEGASDGPWGSARDPSMGHVVEATDMWICEVGNQEGDHENATYIALMQPSVALALADWLDAMAGFVESGNEIPGMRGRGLTEALALADTILGGKT